jgi:hypothetical protein
MCRCCETKAPRMLNAALKGGEWSISPAGRLVAAKFTSNPRSHWIGCWVSPRVYLDCATYNKFQKPMLSVIESSHKNICDTHLGTRNLR